MKENFSEFFEQNLRTRAFLDALRFIDYIKTSNKEGDGMQKAIEFAQSTLKQYLDSSISFPTLDKSGQQRLIPVSSVTTLVCFSTDELIKAS